MSGSDEPPPKLHPASFRLLNGQQQTLDTSWARAINGDVPELKISAKTLSSAVTARWSMAEGTKV